MLTKAQNKYIRSLSQQKYRKQYNVFIAEGVKISEEWLNSVASIQMIVGLEEWVKENEKLLAKHPEASLHIVNRQELEEITALQTPNKVLLVVHQPAPEKLSLNKEWYIALDDIRDPGNMGTIIRIADWFGIKHIICSEHCVEVYSPKVVQGTMGSLLRVQTHTMDLAAFLKDNNGLPVFAAILQGEDIYKTPKHDAGIILIGNESKGISEELIKAASHHITIPRRGEAESLNAAVSTGIICALLVGG